MNLAPDVPDVCGEKQQVLDFGRGSGRSVEKSRKNARSELRDAPSAMFEVIETSALRS